MDHYEVLGVLRTAAQEDIRHAYLAKVQQLHPDKYQNAPSEVRQAVESALVVINDAGRVLQDPKMRAEYDLTLKRFSSPEVHRPSPDSGGLNGSQPGPSIQMFGVMPYYETLSALETLVRWRAPTNHKQNEVDVPDVCGMKASEIWSTIGEADLHPNVVQLTDNPAPVDGTVVTQDPPAGTLVKRFSTVTVEVWHPSAQAAEVQRT